jgi:hypothetical protein
MKMAEKVTQISEEIVIQTILDEIYKSLGVSTTFFFRRFLDPFLKFPVKRFGHICYELNHKISEYGLSQAAKEILPHFVANVSFDKLETIPGSGPLLVISNHCGATDTVCITAGLRRDDLKILAYEVPFYNTLPEVKKHFIYTTDNQHDRMNALRDSIRHLKTGGALLLYGTGNIDPDPTVLEGAEIELEGWSQSIPLIIKNVPDITILLCITSGVVSPRFAKHPVIHLRKAKIDQRRLAEFFQMMYQMIFKTNLDLFPRVTFSSPLKVDELTLRHPGKDILMVLIEQAKTPDGSESKQPQE